MFKIKKQSIEQKIAFLEKTIQEKWKTLNHQEIDEEILAYISLYNYGSSTNKKIAQKWLNNF